MLRLEGVLGNIRDASLAAAVHRLGHHGTVEYLFIAESDVGRKRIRLATDRGTDCAISLSRTELLEDGAVLFLDDARAVVVRVGAARTLRLRPDSIEVALRLGWNAGNLHWRVKFEGNDLVVLLDGPREDYVARLDALLAGAGVEIVDDHGHSDDRQH
jgi:urease accessory protein